MFKNQLIRLGVVVALTCNPSCTGGRDWEDHISRPTEAKS
jgi:hypothetical protein